MSKLEELLQHHCPNGVEMVKLGHLFTRKTEKVKKDNSVKDVYAVTNNRGFVLSTELHDFNVFSEDISNYNIVRKNNFAYNPSRLNVGSIAYYKNDTAGAISPMYIVFTIDTNILNPAYLMLNLHSARVQFMINDLKEEGARFRFEFSKWNKISIPLPPLPVQEEIVRILDSMTALQDNLEAELAERRKQYEYYRNKLLSFE